MSAKDKPFTQLAAKVCGFDKNLDEGLCPTCGVPNPEQTITDELSKKEFDITGMCQSCQNKVFG